MTATKYRNKVSGHMEQNNNDFYYYYYYYYYHYHPHNHSSQNKGKESENSYQKLSLFINSLVMPSLSCVHKHLLSSDDKDGHACRNILIQFPCVSCARSTEIASISGKSFRFPFPYFVIIVLRYFPFHMFIIINV